MLLFKLSKRTAIWATIAAMVVCWLCVDFPYGMSLFFACASWPWVMKRAQKSDAPRLESGVEFIDENGGEPDVRLVNARQLENSTARPYAH